MDIKSLSEVLGHSNIGITLAIYVNSSLFISFSHIGIICIMREISHLHVLTHFLE